MGQPITVVEKPSSRAGIVRYETNRALTGMGHERYQAGDEILGAAPADELARRLFDRGGITGVHVNGNVVTVELAEAEAEAEAEGIDQVIASLYLYWVEGVEVPSDDELMGTDG
ncbi:MAG: hypothetical protein VX782_04210 [Actinomycetota bacterium]|nr:hypothetical protein [Actinomycetota bacterium]MEC9426025.1 hypothetical protein [Actinomycetota bacterium]MEC9448694.1 hypothetical protein [Actinomycetota bacterium]MED5397524.1 hypothetical protein [Actinomycetota bacterium]MED5438221.1 hypothetical protein [Actinomycetota bacterium]